MSNIYRPTKYTNKKELRNNTASWCTQTRVHTSSRASALYALHITTMHAVFHFAMFVCVKANPT